MKKGSKMVKAVKLARKGEEIVAAQGLHRRGKLGRGQAPCKDCTHSHNTVIDVSLAWVLR